MGDNRTLDNLADEQIKSSNLLVFYVNGKKITVPNPDPEWTLLYYLRTKLRITGTKEACGEGGCGACTVLQSKYDDVNGTIKNCAINACLTPLCSVHGTAIITVEGIGSIKTGLHPVQERIAKSHGTQCGFCTPGFVMSMYALLRNNPHPTEDEMEDAFQGNLCRCTGYRPIYEGYKSLCKQEKVSNGNVCCKGNGRNGGCCMDTTVQQTDTLVDETTFKPYDPKQDIIFPPELQLDLKIHRQSLHFKGPNVSWYKPATLHELFLLKNTFPGAKCIGGNTEIGIETRFKQQVYPVLIHVSDVKELGIIQIENETLKIGSAVTLSHFKQFCGSRLSKQAGSVEKAIHDMLHWFAGQQIRNVATLAGNIVTASPISDLNPILMACKAKVNLSSLKNGKRTVSLDESFFLKYRTTVIQPHEVVESIEIPLTRKNEFVWAIKQAKRREDDIAIVNAAFRVLIDPVRLHVEDATLAFGGMAPTTKIATKTSKFLVGKKWSQDTIDPACQELFTELQLSPDVPGGMATYRQVLCQSFLLKYFHQVLFWLSGQSSSIETPSNPSAFTDLSRGDISSVKLYQIVPKSQHVDDLIGRPVTHMSALKHATGEATYTDDEVPLLGQLYGYLVGSPVAHGKIICIDATQALATDGVVDFVTAKDLPEARNLCGPIVQDEEIFATEYIYTQGQTLGLLIATDPLIAEKAGKMVVIKIEELPAIVSIEDALEKKSFLAVRHLKAGDMNKAFEDCDDSLEGEVRMGGQEHFYMETQSCIVTPKEDQEIDVLMSCQGPDVVQKCVAKALAIPANRVRVRCRRMGGAFGGKETRSIAIALPTAVAAAKLGKSVKTVMNRWEDMVLTGGRHPFHFRYKVAFHKSGKILGVKATLSSNGGWSWDSSPVVMEKAFMMIDGAYSIDNWELEGFVCKTNLASNTAFRGYGGPQSSFFIECIMDAVAEKVGISPVEIRRMHLTKPSGGKMSIGLTIENCTLELCWEEVVKNANYEERKLAVEKFNENSEWKKRGIVVTPMRHDVGFHFNPLNQAGALVMIYTDGSVGLNHGGTEMGQGLITKMAQVASRALGGVPLEKIYFSETSTDKVPNATATCASFSSDLNGMAVKDACEQLAKRLEPFKQANPTGSWEDWVAAAYFNRVNLSAVGFYETNLGYDFEKPEDLSRSPHLYTVYGAAVSEVEIDCLTGDHQVLRTDIVIDVGESLNPAVDMGQIEGAFTQGYGLFTMEELLYSPKGQMLTKGPGMYKIPSMGDIPREFNVALLRGAPNPKAVYSSKGIGEPPLFLAASIFFAIKEAIKASRKERGLSTLFRLDSPATGERIRLAIQDKLVVAVDEKMAETGKTGPGWAVRA